MRSLGDLVYNFHWIEPGKAARSSQAYAGFLGSYLRARGVRSMINLRGPNPDWRWWRNEKRVCAALGIEHRDVMLSSKNLPSRSMLVALLDAFDQVARPFLMKCSGGQDRTGFAAGIYLVHVRGWGAVAQAQEQLKGWPYLHWPRQNQRWLRLFLVFANENAGSASLRHWIEAEYSPEKFRAWLEARGEAAAFAALHREPGPALR